MQLLMEKSIIMTTWQMHGENAFIEDIIGMKRERLHGSIKWNKRGAIAEITDR